MGKWKKQLNNLSQTFTIRTLNVMNMSQVFSPYHTPNENDGIKTVVTVKPGTGTINMCTTNLLVHIFIQ